MFFVFLRSSDTDTYRHFIHQDIILDPVRTCDGHVFERSAILAWFAKWPGLSPLTGAMLPDSTLSPDDELRDRIQELISKKGRGGRQVVRKTRTIHLCRSE